MKKFYSGLILLFLSVNLFGFNLIGNRVDVEPGQKSYGVEACIVDPSTKMSTEPEHEALMERTDEDRFINPAIHDKELDLVVLGERSGSMTYFSESDQSSFKIWYQKKSNQIVVTSKENIRFSGALFDITGSLVKDQRKIFVENRLVFPTSGLKKGIYVVTLYGNGGAVLNISKVVVN
ncbi:hypothetical protein ACT29H_05895 [Thermophagus sp. OGC60D27]|uniref:hypothetical protein n=1 Tax=Thermophagus sp. OGC60D27 TaxID=3458415 RepID=UPI0040383186